MSNTKHEQDLAEYELKPEEIESVTGGLGGSKYPMTDKEGCIVYAIKRCESLAAIAAKYNTTVSEIMALNPSITNESDISSGRYIYIPVV